MFTFDSPCSPSLKSAISKQTWDFGSPHRMTIRIVRFKITEDKYETIATSLNRFEFPAERIKELYNMRWGIETSFRDLKYAIGMVNFHARKDNSIMQEIYASLVMYNFSERITACAVVVQADGNISIKSILLCRLISTGSFSGNVIEHQSH